MFLHHGLLVGPTGIKLSKSNRDTGIRDLRARGMSPAAVLGLAAFVCGLRAERELAGLRNRGAVHVILM